MTYITDSKTAAELLFDRKHQLFLNFNDHTDQVENSILYLNAKLATLAQEFTLKSFQYLDVGCGFGNNTLSMINSIQKYHPVNAVALDPSATLLAMFKEQITDQSVDLVCSTWSDYNPTTHFHFISSIHAFYYIDNWENAIKKMLAALDKNGVICIALRSIDAVCQFRDFFYDKIHEGNKKERNCDELCELLKQLGLHYKIDYVDSVLDVKDCLQQNEKGEQLIEFILRQPYATLHAIKDEIISYIENTHENGYLTQRDGYVWIRCLGGAKAT